MSVHLELPNTPRGMDVWPEVSQKIGMFPPINTTNEIPYLEDETPAWVGIFSAFSFCAYLGDPWDLQLLA